MLNSLNTLKCLLQFKFSEFLLNIWVSLKLISFKESLIICSLSFKIFFISSDLIELLILLLIFFILLFISTKRCPFILSVLATKNVLIKLATEDLKIETNPTEQGLKNYDEVWTTFFFLLQIFVYGFWCFVWNEMSKFFNGNIF